MSDLNIEYLIQKLQDKNPSIRSNTALLLGNTKNKNTVKYLIKILDDKDIEVRCSAIYALGEIRDETAITRLENCLFYRDLSINFKTVEALIKIGKQNSIIRALQYAQSYDALEIAANALREMGEEKAVQYLIGELWDTDGGGYWRPHQGKGAARALAKLRSKAAVEPLIRVLKDKYSQIHEDVAYALGEIGDETAVPILIETLKNKTGLYFCETVVEALGKIGNKAVVNLLIEVLQNHDNYYGDNARLKAIEALKNIGDISAIESLIEALHDEDDLIFIDVGDAISEILVKNPQSHSKVKDYLRKAALSKNTIVRGYGISFLGYICDEASISLIINALQDEDFTNRYCAIHALEKIANEEAISSLVEATKSEHNSVRERAINALNRIKIKL